MVNEPPRLRRSLVKSLAEIRRKNMKNQTILRRIPWLLAICVAAAFALSACHSTEEHPSAGPGTKEHPEHPNTNAPAKKP
jgi:hypothetical protein